MRRFVGLAAVLGILGGETGGTCFAAESPGDHRGTGASARSEHSHHLACRENDTTHSRIILDSILSREKLDGVILYFHGGLSSQDYMEEQLGEMLMGSLFAQLSMQSYYPVFMNYDAGIGQQESIEYQIQSLATDAAFVRAKEKFVEKLGIPSSQLKALKAPSASQESVAVSIARSHLDSAARKSKQNLKMLQGKEEDKQQLYFQILRDDKFAKDIEDSITEQDSDFSEMRKDLLAAAGEPQVGSEKSLMVSRPIVIVARSLARIAIGTHHQFVPTLEEEAFRAFGAGGVSIQKIAARHWKMVKRNAGECFEERSAGRYLVDELGKRQIPIHTVSHSAGSLPTGQLLAYFAGRGYTLSSVNLIVPAINQRDFDNLFIANQSAAKKIQGYILRQAEEESDSIAWGAYPASLLYFVSGAADDAWYNDQMLLLDQHLQSARTIYSSNLFRTLTGENPAPVWRYLRAEKDNWFYYPSDQLQYETGMPGKRASHECTKYPWIASEIARNIIFAITGERASSIPEPVSPQKKIAKANKTCQWAKE